MGGSAAAGSSDGLTARCLGIVRVGGCGRERRGRQSGWPTWLQMPVAGCARLAPDDSLAGSPGSPHPGQPCLPAVPPASPLQLFPYHLGEYVCRQMRLSPFRYYSSVLADSMREDAPYDSIPNFTVGAGEAGWVGGLGCSLDCLSGRPVQRCRLDFLGGCWLEGLNQRWPACLLDCIPTLPCPALDPLHRAP